MTGEIRRELDDIERDEQQLLALRTAEAESRVPSTLLVLAAGAVLQFALLFAVYSAMSRDAADRLRIAERMRGAAHLHGGDHRQPRGGHLRARPRRPPDLHESRRPGDARLEGRGSAGQRHARRDPFPETRRDGRPGLRLPAARRSQVGREVPEHGRRVHAAGRERLPGGVRLFSLPADGRIVGAVVALPGHRGSKEDGGGAGRAGAAGRVRSRRGGRSDQGRDAAEGSRTLRRGDGAASRGRDGLPLDAGRGRQRPRVAGERLGSPPSLRAGGARAGRRISNRGDRAGPPSRRCWT